MIGIEFEVPSDSASLVSKPHTFLFLSDKYDASGVYKQKFSVKHYASGQRPNSNDIF